MYVMKPPCEVVVKKVIPTVRALLARDLSNRYDMSQSKIANKLCITQPAVSQYLNSGEKVERVKETLKDSGLYSRLLELSDDMVNGNKRIEITKKYCEICKDMEKEEILTILNVDKNPIITEEECDECLEVRNETSEENEK